MKKIVIPALLMFSIISCDQPHSGSANDIAKDTSAKPAPAEDVATDTMQLKPSITAFELADDSVFADGSIPTSWENAGFTDVKGFKLFLKQVQIWVMDNKKEQLASVIKYPLKQIKTPGELVANYDAVFTKDVKLSFATINFNQIFRRDQGAMTAGGKVWFAQFGKEFKIIAINN